MIKIKNLCAGYGGEEILHDNSLEVEAGKVTVIIGPNGCGKSTLLKTIVRLHKHTSGHIFVNDDSVEQLDSVTLAQRVAYLPQNKKTPDISVLRMVLHGRFAYLKYPRRYRKEDYDMAKKALQWVGIEHLAEKDVNELSGGNQQKVYIAMALAQDTPVVLLDEPTTYLDIAHQLKTMELVKELAKQGKAVLMVLHDLTQAFQAADKIIVMEDGQIKCCGTPDEVYTGGVVEDVFKIGFKRLKIDNEWKYYIDER